MIEGKRYRRAVAASRESIGDEEDMGLSDGQFRILDSQGEAGRAVHSAVPEPVIPRLNLGDSIWFTGNVCFDDLGIKVRGVMGSDFILPVTAAMLYLVEGRNGEMKAVFCDESGSYDLPIRVQREKERFREVIIKTIELAKLEESEDEEGNLRLVDETGEDLGLTIEEMVLYSDWSVSRVARDIGRKMAVADCIYRATGRYDSEIVF